MLKKFKNITISEDKVSKRKEFKDVEEIKSIRINIKEIAIRAYSRFQWYHFLMVGRRRPKKGSERQDN